MVVNPWTDHLPVFDALFSTVKVSSFLEFGTGDGTLFFLERCPSVTSVEMATRSRRELHTAWYDTCVARYSGFGNWNHSLYECGDDLSNADEAAQRGERLLGRHGPGYLGEIAELVAGLTASSPDVAFVDCGVHARGDIVNALFGKVPLIVAHDMGGSPVEYGWVRIKVPNGYRAFGFSTSQGVTLWASLDSRSVFRAVEDLHGREVSRVRTVETVPFGSFGTDGLREWGPRKGMTRLSRIYEDPRRKLFHKLWNEHLRKTRSGFFMDAVRAGFFSGISPLALVVLDAGGSCIGYSTFRCDTPENEFSVKSVDGDIQVFLDASEQNKDYRALYRTLLERTRGKGFVYLDLTPRNVVRLGPGMGYGVIDLDAVCPLDSLLDVPDIEPFFRRFLPRDYVEEVLALHGGVS